MPDISISQLDPGTPTSTDVLPFSNGSVTRKVQAQSLPVSWASVTSKPSWTSLNIGTNAVGTRRVEASSAGVPTGGSDGDIVYQY